MGQANQFGVPVPVVLAYRSWKRRPDWV